MAFCCGINKPKPPRPLSDELTSILKNTNFTVTELQEMNRRFQDVTQGRKYMNKDMFREIMGFVDNQSSKKMVDRIYDGLAEVEGVDSRSYAD